MKITLESKNPPWLALQLYLWLEPSTARHSRQSTSRHCAESLRHCSLHTGIAPIWVSCEAVCESWLCLPPGTLSETGTVKLATESVHWEAHYVVVATIDAAHEGTSNTLDAVRSSLVHWLTRLHVCRDHVLAEHESARNPCVFNSFPHEEGRPLILNRQLQQVQHAVLNAEELVITGTEK